jgi:hypothetical protein
VRRTPAGPRYLADAASFGFAIARLAEVTRDAPLRDHAVRIARALERDFTDPATGKLFEKTPDAAAVGVFARRLHPFTHNVMAARLYATLARATGDGSWADKGKRLVSATCTPRVLSDRGRMLGDVLLTLDDLGVVGW